MGLTAVNNHSTPRTPCRDIKTQMAPHVQARDPKRVMSFGIMQESNGSDEDSDDSESEYTIGVHTHTHLGM